MRMRYIHFRENIKNSLNGPGQYHNWSFDRLSMRPIVSMAQPGDTNCGDIALATASSDAVIQALQAESPQLRVEIAPLTMWLADFERGLGLYRSGKRPSTDGLNKQLQVRPSIPCGQAGSDQVSRYEARRHEQAGPRGPEGQTTAGDWHAAK